MQLTARDVRDVEYSLFKDKYRRRDSRGVPYDLTDKELVYLSSFDHGSDTDREAVYKRLRDVGKK